MSQCLGSQQLSWVQPGRRGSSPQPQPDPPWLQNKAFKLLSFPIREVAGAGTGSPRQLMQADLMLHPGKSWLPEATSLIRSL